jgi:hypothetical protein
MTKGRKSCTAGDRCEPRNLAESVYCAVHHSAIDARTIAERIGVRVGYLLDAANPDRDDMQFQSRHLIPLMTVTGNLLPLQFLAEQLECLLVSMPESVGTTDSVFETFTRAVARIGADGELIRRALADDALDLDEAARICHSINHTMEATAQIKQAVLARVGGSRKVRP